MKIPIVALLCGKKNLPEAERLIPIYELHVNQHSRKKYKIEDALFESTGNVVFPNFRSVRGLAYAINKERGVLNYPDKQIRAGKLNAIGLLDEINHFLIKLYNEQENPGAVQRAYQHVEKVVGKNELEKTLKIFLTEFPPKEVYKGNISVDEYFERLEGGKHTREIALEELILLYFSNANPSFSPVKELFDDISLAATSYKRIYSSLEKFFAREKTFGPDNESLIAALMRPIRQFPDNIEAQLGYYKERWGVILASKFLEKIDRSFEFTKEEENFIWNMFHPHGGTPTADMLVPKYPKKLSPEEYQHRLKSGLLRPEDMIYEEPERFTPDSEWMPNVVLIAKNTYVWLDQLSKKYQRSIKRLNEIPDEELDQLARWNFTGLWLIGVWERCNASKKIKQINGNQDAVSSAYSLYDYEIAHDLGGEEAYQNLNHRAWQRGIRLAGDMVPNHMGLFSKWVIEHPEYFIQSDRPPYPNYQFTGPNLSDDPTIELRIEDKYWSRSDAAVVFQRVDKRYGDVRYIYHGNDGTSMPWNDTAQLNVLRADVREAVIQNIFHVARKFSIIRFDAAMTLAKKHFQRLWYPMPGTSGVPSREDFGLSRSEFDAMFPKEFWREVVDRFNAEMPQTLLLAEAFWLMEGYFVRTLGMHRVYNSAFMHMLMKEENEKFRNLIKNTLEYNPEILKRYVNFMSNPDEETAVAQFGKDDKYFGVSTVMVTLPGLPMFAHGQIEGFTEKYGMEYQRAYYNESTDEWLVRRHEHEIFPLMHKRYLFSHVSHFEFYDFHDERGFVNENVFAYSNIIGNERAVILFHNTFSETTGWIRISVPKAESEGGKIRSVSLGEGLQLNGNDKIFYRYRDRKSNLEYLISGKELHQHGLRFELKAFHYAVLMDFQEIYDESGEYEKIAKQVHRKGVSNLDDLFRIIHLQPLHKAIREFAGEVMKRNTSAIFSKYETVISETQKYTRLSININQRREVFKEFYVSTEKYLSDEQNGIPKKQAKGNGALLFDMLFYIAFELENLNSELQNSGRETVFSVFQLENVFGGILHLSRTKDAQIHNQVALFKVLVKNRNLILDAGISDSTLIEGLFNDFETADFLNVNLHNDIWYFNKEQFETLIRSVLSIRFIVNSGNTKTNNPFLLEKDVVLEKIDLLVSNSIDAGFQVESFKEKLLSKKVVKEDTTKTKRIDEKTQKQQKKGIRRKSQNKRKR